MREVQFYRYFLGCRPDSHTRAELARAGEAAGQRFRPDLSHLTFCVIAEARERDPSLRSRVEGVLAGQPLHAAPIPLGRVMGGPQGAMVRTMGRQPAIHDLYGLLVRRLAICGIAPLHRKSGLRTHVTLGYDPCTLEPFNIALEWTPTELLLIESEVGLTRHNVLRSWPLLPPRQGVLPLAFPPAPRPALPLRLAS